MTRIAARNCFDWHEAVVVEHKHADGAWMARIFGASQSALGTISLSA
jgi:hypothetical protein